MESSFATDCNGFRNRAPQPSISPGRKKHRAPAKPQEGSAGHSGASLLCRGRRFESCWARHALPGVSAPSRSQSRPVSRCSTGAGASPKARHDLRARRPPAVLSHASSHVVRRERERTLLRAPRRPRTCATEVRDTSRRIAELVAASARGQFVAAMDFVDTATARW